MTLPGGSPRSRRMRLPPPLSAWSANARPRATPPWLAPSKPSSRPQPPPRSGTRRPSVPAMPSRAPPWSGQPSTLPSCPSLQEDPLHCQEELLRQPTSARPCFTTKPWPCSNSTPRSSPSATSGTTSPPSSTSTPVTSTVGAISFCSSLASFHSRAMSAKTLLS
jgi:hypothetical protein